MGRWHCFLQKVEPPFGDEKKRRITKYCDRALAEVFMGIRALAYMEGLGTALVSIPKSCVRTALDSP